MVVHIYDLIRLKVDSGRFEVRASLDYVMPSVLGVGYQKEEKETKSEIIIR